MKRRILLHYFTHPGLNQREEIEIYNCSSQPLSSSFLRRENTHNKLRVSSILIGKIVKTFQTLTKLVHVLIKSTKTNGSRDPIMHPW